MSPTLRDYQAEAEAAVFAAKESGVRTIAGRMFTGGGKTVVFAHIIKRLLPGRAMVLAHRQELIWQARNKIQWVTGQNVGIEMGEHKATMERDMFHPRDSIIVSTVQTHTAGGDGAGRIGKFDPADFVILIIDEAHRAISPSYRRVVDYYLTNPNLIVLGVTATPDRADEKAMGQMFETVAFDYDINYGRQNGWLVELDAMQVHIEDLDFSSVKANSDDLNSSDLSRVMTMEKPLYGIVDATLSLVGNKKGIGFSPSVAHAKMTCDIFNRYNPGSAAFISGATDKDERNMINAQFAEGKIRWIWNCGTHTEGFDDPGVEVIIPKPTKSRALYEQMIGRGTRPLEAIAGRLGNMPHRMLRREVINRSGKASCTVLDFYGNSGRHKLVTVFDILGGDMTQEAVDASIELARRTGNKPVRVGKTLEEEEKRQAEIKARKEAEAAKKAGIKVKATFKTTKVDPFNLMDVKPVVSRGWHEGKKLTDRQKQVLINAKFDPDKMEYARAAQLVGIILDRYRSNKCSLAQVDLMVKCGWDKAEVKEYSREQARFALDAAKANSYRKPPGFRLPSEAPAEREQAVPAGYSGMNDNDDDVPF